MSVAIRDVAKRLGLSITTVSRALDGYADVAEDTRQIILRTAHEMGYAPNQAARQLRRQRADSIGYILPAEKPRFSDPFFAEFIAGLGDEASSRGVDLLVSSAQPGSEHERQLYQRWANSHKVDGFVLNRMHTTDWRAAYLQQAAIPFVTFERPPGCDLAVTGFDGVEGFEHAQLPSTTVNQPVYQIARKLVDMLLNQISGSLLPERRIQIDPMLEIRESTIGK